MKVEFKPIDKSVIHKNKLTDDHTVVISTSKAGRQCLLVPTSSYNHGMNNNCTTKKFKAKTIDEKGLHPFDLDSKEKELEAWVEYCEKKNYKMFAFSTLKKAINELF